MVRLLPMEVGPVATAVEVTEAAMEIRRDQEANPPGGKSNTGASTTPPWASRDVDATRGRPSPDLLVIFGLFCLLLFHTMASRCSSLYSVGALYFFFLLDMHTSRGRYSRKVSTMTLDEADISYFSVSNP